MEKEAYKVTATVTKSTLGEWNRGICGNANNCYYKGTSPAWVVTLSDENEYAFNLKWAAEDFAAWINEGTDLEDYNGVGDLVMRFTNREGARIVAGRRDGKFAKLYFAYCDEKVKEV